MLQGLGVRLSAERAGLLVSRAAGGLQLPSVVECMVARVACELLAPLNGSAQASTVARDSLLEGMLVLTTEGASPGRMGWGRLGWGGGRIAAVFGWDGVGSDGLG